MKIAQILERLWALIEKEWLQVFRDPSALLVAFALPIVMLVIFGYGLSLDADHVGLGVVMEDRAPDARALWRAFDSTPYFETQFYDDRRSAEQALTNGKTRAVLVVPSDFSKSLEAGAAPAVQLLVDGSEANLALIIESYAQGVYAKFLSNRARDAGLDASALANTINVEAQMRYNETRTTRNSLVPGSIVIILAMIGTLLTTMVVAREWERGTMEATISTPIGKFELILGKLIPYFMLGLGAAFFCAIISRFVFHVPFRGSTLAYLYVSSVFLLAATSQGLLISTLCRNQTLASQIALLTSFLPNFIFSGALFEIAAMPTPIRALTYLFPARYFTVCLQTVFMAGNVWSLLAAQSARIALIAVVFLVATIFATRQRLE